MTGFTPSYSDMYVSSNTAQTPIIIKNQSIAYTLPATGGVGLVPFLGGGSLLILASGLYSYKLIRSKGGRAHRTSRNPHQNINKKE